MRKRILILHSGGTLGMTPREPDRVLAPSEFGSTLLGHVPELQELAEVDTRVLFNLDSSDVGPEHWLRLANEIFASLENYDGVVVTHGTDTMAYSASALSFLLRGLPKSVVLTGSQRPLAEPHTDARANLVGAVDMARHDLREVTVYFHGRLLRGNRASKQSSFAYGAFRSPNFPLLAEVGTSVRWITPAPAVEGPFELAGGFDPRVAAVRLLPGPTDRGLAALARGEMRAVLVEAFGVGDIPTEADTVATAIRELVAAGKVVAIGSQCPHGGVDLTRYVGGRLARESGAVGIGDMTLEAATVKLMYLLHAHDDADEVRRRMGRPLAGEVSAPQP